MYSRCPNANHSGPICPWVYFVYIPLVTEVFCYTNTALCSVTQHSVVFRHKCSVVFRHTQRCVPSHEHSTVFRHTNSAVFCHISTSFCLSNLNKTEQIPILLAHRTVTKAKLYVLRLTVDWQYRTYCAVHVTAVQNVLCCTCNCSTERIVLYM